LQALEHASQCPSAAEFTSRLSDVGYVRFLGARQSATEEMPRLYLTSRRTDLVAQLRSRQQRFPGATALRARLRRLADLLGRLRQRAPLLGLVLLIVLAPGKVLKRAVRRMAAGGILCAARLRGPAAANRVERRAQLATRSTPLEVILAEYGFYWVRDEVRRRRLAALPFAAQVSSFHPRSTKRRATSPKNK